MLILHGVRTGATRGAFLFSLASRRNWNSLGTGLGEFGDRLHMRNAERAVILSDTNVVRTVHMRKENVVHS